MYMIYISTTFIQSFPAVSIIHTARITLKHLLINQSIKNLEGGTDVHWRPYWQSCSPCIIPYDAGNYKTFCQICLNVYKNLFKNLYSYCHCIAKATAAATATTANIEIGSTGVCDSYNTVLFNIQLC